MQGARSPEFIKRMTEETLDITTTEGKKDFIRNLVAYNIILEGIWFYSGFMVALSFQGLEALGVPEELLKNEFALSCSQLKL